MSNPPTSLEQLRAQAAAQGVSEQKLIQLSLQLLQPTDVREISDQQGLKRQLIPNG